MHSLYIELLMLGDGYEYMIMMSLGVGLKSFANITILLLKPLICGPLVSVFLHVKGWVV